MSEEIDPPFSRRTFPGVARVFLGVHFVLGQVATTLLAFSFGVADVVGLVFGQGFFPISGLVGSMIL